MTALRFRCQTPTNPLRMGTAMSAMAIDPIFIAIPDVPEFASSPHARALGDQAADILRAQSVSGRQNQFAPRYIFPNLNDILPRRSRRQNFNFILPKTLRALHHHDGICARWQHPACMDFNRLPLSKFDHRFSAHCHNADTRQVSRK